MTDKRLELDEEPDAIDWMLPDIDRRVGGCPLPCSDSWHHHADNEDFVGWEREIEEGGE